jgi:hypothetical protein
VPPTTYLRTWSTRDRGLAEGLLLYEAGMGPHGIPMHAATDPDMDGWYEVDERTDYAQAAIDRWRDSLHGKPEPGVYPVVRDVRQEREAP